MEPYWDIHSDHKSKNIIQVNSIGEYYKMIGLSKMFDNNLEEVSKFCKNVEKFNEINETDQLVLFKSASWNLNCLRNLERHSLHDQDDDQWTYTHIGDYCLLYQGNLMKQTVGEANYELFKNFGRSISPEWADDPNLVNLLMIICIFNDTLPQLANKNLVKLNQQIYLYLLQRYLTQKYRSDVKSSESLSLIMNSLKILQTTHKLKISLAKQFEQYFSPLVRETFAV